MGGFLRLFDFNQGSMAKKIVPHKRHVAGLEAPRNSLELPVETSHYRSVRDNVPYSFQVKQGRSVKNGYPTEASMKKLISEEVSKGPSIRRSGPSIIARLMGMDMLPLDTKSVDQPVEKKNEKSGTSFPKKEKNKKVSVGPAHFNSNSSIQMEFGSLHHYEDTVPDRQSGSAKLKKPKRREHPQEEELQKFKKEFEAWQAARFRECSKIVELGSISSQLLAQEHLNKERISVYANSDRMIIEKPVEVKAQTVKTRMCEGGLTQIHGYKNERKESFPTRSRTLSRDFEQSPVVYSDQKVDIPSGPTKIVILRPAPDQMGNNEESWASSSGNSEERGGIEDFLAEVKARLKSELQGKSIKRGTIIRGGGIETPYREKRSDPKQIAQHIAKQARESVTRDLRMNLLRSESTRSYRNEIQFNGPGSPEFINRDTRRFLSERLRNVLKNESHLDIPMVVGGSSRSSIFDNEMGRIKQSGDTLKAGFNLSYSNSTKDKAEMQTRSFRCGPDDDIKLHKELSPRNLIRSLSAPVSGTSFGKLLLEDRHILTGAQIRRKHEVIEKITADVEKRKKERFNLREKVSSFKYGFTLAGRLFGRKIHLPEESHNHGHVSVKDITSGPTVVTNLCDRPENSTEVPPSPASMCSSVHEELWGPGDYLSQTSASDLHPLDDTTVPQIFREISSNLNELRRQLNQLGTDCLDETMIEEQPLEAELFELDDDAEAYIRDLLVASGLYDGSSDKILSRRDLLANSISNQVFEEVEESYKNLAKDAGVSRNDHVEKRVDHKVLLDLLNEALPVVLGPPVTMSAFGKKAIGHMLPPPRGRKLLDCVWEIVREHIYPSKEKSSCSLDTLVARDIDSIPWSRLMNDDIDTLGKDIESQIISDLVEEIVKDVH